MIMTKKNLNFEIDIELHAKLRIEAANRRTTIKELVVKAIEKELKTTTPKRGKE